MDEGYLEGVQRVKSAMQLRWRQRHKSMPSPQWLGRADAIEREPKSLKAMILYQALRRDMEYLEEAIETAATELDIWIQHQVDFVRGK